MSLFSVGEEWSLWLFHFPYEYVILALTAQPTQSAPQRATMVLSTTTGVAEPTSSSTTVDLGNSPSSSMLCPTIFHGKLENMNKKKREIKNLY